MFDKAEREKCRSSAVVLVGFLFSLFTIALWPASFVTNVHVSRQKSIVRSSPLIESLKKMKCTDTSGDSQQHQYCLGGRQTSGPGRHGQHATESSPTPHSMNTGNGASEKSWTTNNHSSLTLASSPDEQRPQTHEGSPSLQNFNHKFIVETKPWAKASFGYHSKSYGWKGQKERNRLGSTGKQTNMGFSKGIPLRKLKFSFFDGEVNVHSNSEWSTLCALGRRTIEATLVIFCRRALIFFFAWKLLEKCEKSHHFCADAQWWSPSRRKKVEKGHLALSNWTWKKKKTNGFRKMKGEGQITKRYPRFIMFA